MEARTTTRTHLSALADLSRWAIEVNDLDALLKLAIAQIADTVDADFGLVLGLNDGRDAFTVRACVGTAYPPLDGARCDLEPAFSPRGSEPLIVPDFAAAGAVAVPSLLVGCSITSGVALSLGGESSSLGVLAVYSRRRDHFDAEDVTFLRSGANLLASAIQRLAGERRLGQTREHSWLMVELLRNAIIIIDDDSRILSVNPAATELFGYTAQEFATLRPRELLFSEERQHASSRFELGLRPDQPVSLMGRRRRKDGSTVHVSINASRITRGGTLATLLEYSDISELAEATARLGESEERLRLIFDTVQAALIISDNDERIVLANRAAAEMLGYTPEELAERRPGDFVHPDERKALRERTRSRTLSNPSTPRFRRRMVRKDGDSVWVEATPTLMQAHGEVTGRVVEYRDVSAQVEAEAAIRERDERLEALLAAAPVMLFRVDRGRRIMFSGGSAQLRAGVPEGEAVGITIDERYADDPDALSRMQRAFDGASFSEVVEYRGLQLLANYQALRDEVTGEPDGFLVVSMDITDRVEAERALRDREAKLTQAQRMAGLGWWEWYPDNDEVRWGDEVYALYGLEPGSPQTRHTFGAAVHPDDRKEQAAAARRALKLREPYSIDHRVVLPDGTIRHVHQYGEVVEAPGERLFIRGTVQDITERVEAERAIAESEAKYRSLFDNAEVGMFRIRVSDGVVLELNERLVQMRGYRDLQEFADTGERSITSFLDRELREQMFSALLRDGKVDDFEFEVPRKDGSIATLRTFIRANLELDMAEGVVVDVSERVQAERALGESEQRLRSVTETVDAGMMMVDRDQSIIFVNARLEELTGTPKEELIGHPLQFERWFAPRDVDLVEGGLRARLRGDRVHDDYDLQLHRADGTSIDVAISANPVVSDGQVVGVVAMLRDVTEEVAAQESLRESEERNRAIVDSVAVPLTVWSPRDELLHHNHAACELTGYSSDELATMRLQDILDGEMAEVIFSDATDARAGIDPQTRICDVIRADGERRTVMLSMAAIEFPGESSALLVQTVDVSREFDMERRLTVEIVERAEERREFVQQLLRAQEEERRQVAYEIHDGPAQQLTGAAMFFETFRNERTRSESDVAERRLELGLKYLNDALTETRRIMSRLRPALLDDLGLVPALRSSLSELTSNASIGFELKITGKEARLDPSTEIVLFRVAQEAVGNAVRHSGGTCVWLDLGFFPGRTELTVRDDGQGFDPVTVAHIREEGRHLGLVGMRERTELLDGLFDIDSSPGRGARLRVTIPRQPAGSAEAPEHSDG